MWLFQLFLLLLATVPSIVASFSESAPVTATATFNIITNVISQHQLYLELFLAFSTSVAITKYILPIPTKQRKSLQSCISSITTFAMYTYRYPDYVQQNLINPLQLYSSLLWSTLLLLKIGALALLDYLIMRVVRQCLDPKPLSFRTKHPNVKGLVNLQWIDYLYLSMNQVIEYIFMLNVIQFSLTNDNVYWSLTGKNCCCKYIIDDIYLSYVQTFYMDF